MGRSRPKLVGVSHGEPEIKYLADRLASLDHNFAYCLAKFFIEIHPEIVLVAIKALRIAEQAKEETSLES